MRYKAVLVYVDPETWPEYQELCGQYKVSQRIRYLIEKDLKRLTEEEVRAQQLAGLTEA